MKKQNNATLESISKHLNISVSTVSRALNGQSEKYRISKKTTQLIHEAAEEFNYEPNQLARGLRLQKSNTIGIIVPDITNPFFSKIVRWIENAAREAGISVLISDSNEQNDNEQKTIQVFSSRKVDGIILSPVGSDSRHLVNVNKNIPLVLIDRNYKDLKIPFVGSNNDQGAKDATDYLIMNGHKRIAFIQGIVESSVNKDRLRGYRSALRRNKIPIDQSIIVGNSFGEENGYIEAKLLLSAKKNITAIFASSNLIALGAIRAIKEEKLKIPDDISIISFDDQPYSEFLETPMTTVSQSGREIGSLAFKLLNDLINGTNNHNDSLIQLPTKLIVRESVKNINQNN